MNKNLKSKESKNSSNEKSFSAETKSNKTPSLNQRRKSKKESFIPKEVANRMARRIAFTTGLPTLAGMGVFIGSYLLIIKGIRDVPPSLTLATSAICFLIGLLGLSYGILSASWEKSAGSLLGLENIRPNIGRMRSAFKTVPTQNKDKK